MKTYDGTDLSRYQTAWFNWTTPQIADEFCSESVSAAIRASQAKDIDYHEFLKRIARAGIAYYTVHFTGAQSDLLWPARDSFVEPFPNQ